MIDTTIEAGADWTVGVVITTYNDLHFLSEAICSVLSQTHAPAEILVVNDGSTADPSSTVAKYPGVRLISQPNMGLAAARNTGLRHIESSHVLFLDADDRLDRHAVEAGLACFRNNPDAAFVYGAFREIGPGGEAIGGKIFYPLGWNPYCDLLRSNLIGMHAAVLYRRSVLLNVGGFDTSFRCCEDYDLYLRIARRHSIAGHSTLVAEYRRHAGGMSNNASMMLRTVLQVHGRQPRASQIEDEAWTAGRRKWISIYAPQIYARSRSQLATCHWLEALRCFTGLLVLAPGWLWQMLRSNVKRARVKPQKLRRPTDCGDLSPTEPLRKEFGFERGPPVNRHYIEKFLREYAADITGKVLEIGDDGYSRRFGGDCISHQDILHVHLGNRRATIVGDLSTSDLLPANTYDCMIIVETLHLIFDFKAAIANLQRALKPGGVLLLTVPGISRIDSGEWENSWYWAFTRLSMQRLFCNEFGAEGVTVRSYGNVFAATAFLNGVAVEEINARKLERNDPAYPLVVGVRARKAGVPDVHPRG